MERNQEFTDILSILSGVQNGSESQEVSSTLKNRHEKLKLFPGKELSPPQVQEYERRNQEQERISFVMPFMAECNLLNSTLLQLSNQVDKVKDRPDLITFSHQQQQANTKSSMGKIEEGLDICSTNISVLTDRLETEYKRIEDDSKLRSKSNISFFNFFYTSKEEEELKVKSYIIFEHFRLVLQYLTFKIGKITEKVEAVKERERKKKELLSGTAGKLKIGKIVRDIDTKDNSLRSNTNYVDYISTDDSSTISTTTTTTTGKITEQQQQLLQSENTKMLEEMAKNLFSTLESTETQVLQIARLQTTLQSHLTAQYDLTRRLFEDSEIVNSETKKGNEYLRRTAEDSSVLRKILVILLLMASVLLFLLHYFNN